MVLASCKDSIFKGFLKNNRMKETNEVERILQETFHVFTLKIIKFVANLVLFACHLLYCIILKQIIGINDF